MALTKPLGGTAAGSATATCTLAAFAPYTTPSERTLIVSAETRLLVIAAEDRTLEITAETRTLIA
jgi:hypothetical protein